MPASGRALNLSFEDLLEFQYARSPRPFVILVVGAFDGLTNDPVGHFARTHDCSGVFLEPQPRAFARLEENLGEFPKLQAINAAVDRAPGKRLLYYVPPGDHGLPIWTEQLASFDRSHLERHEARAPGLSSQIREYTTRTVTFPDVLAEAKMKRVDLLQMDAEGMDAQLIDAFPLVRTRPSIVRYEVEHLSPLDRAAARGRLAAFGYWISTVDDLANDIALLL